VKPLRIALVAAEPSGDLLAAGLMQKLNQQHTNIVYEGIGGPLMQQQGLQSLEPLETLSVMGLIEVLAHLPKLLKLQKRIIKSWLKNPPDIFIGIDAPDFNLKVETVLKANGIATVHYVCPTVWAWRPKRVIKIKKAVNLLLSIFPFEEAFLTKHQVQSVYVGHKLANDMPIEVDKNSARSNLAIAKDVPVLAVLPGSRGGEISRLTKPFLETVKLCLQEIPTLKVVIPFANQSTATKFSEIHQELGIDVDYQEVIADSAIVLAASDVVLVASGTATFEALLSKRPMVVGYKLNKLTYWIAKTFNLITIEHVAMANLLSGKYMAPEFLQDRCEAELLAPAVLNFFNDTDKVAAIKMHYAEVHQSLRVDSDQIAADAVTNLLRERNIV